jgi:ferrous iron transport protein B
VRKEYAARRAALEAAASPGPQDQQAARTAQSAELARLNLEEKSQTLRGSFAGRLGHLIEPAIAPLGFDWKIGIGIISSFAAREVFVSTMSQVYNAGEEEENFQGGHRLTLAMREQKRPDGQPMYTTLLGLSLMVFYVFALQCASTVAVTRRETGSWKWPLIQWLYLGGLAWMFSFATWQGGHLLGFR